MRKYFFDKNTETNQRFRNRVLFRWNYRDVSGVDVQSSIDDSGVDGIYSDGPGARVFAGVQLAIQVFGKQNLGGLWITIGTLGAVKFPGDEKTLQLFFCLLK